MKRPEYNSASQLSHNQLLNKRAPDLLLTAPGARLGTTLPNLRYCVNAAVPERSFTSQTTPPGLVLIIL